MMCRMDSYIFVVAGRQRCAIRLKRLWGVSYSIGGIPGTYAMSLIGDVAGRPHPQPGGKRLAP